MAVFNRLPHRFLAILSVPALLVMASCGTDDGLGKRYPVSGTVTYNGKWKVLGAGLGNWGGAEGQS